MTHNKCKFKVVLLGQAASGKTSIATRYVMGTFTQHTQSTCGAAFFEVKVPVDAPDTLDSTAPEDPSTSTHEPTTVTFNLSDSSGEERYSSLQRLYYRNCDCAWVVFDVTHKDSLRKARTWINELRRHEDTRFIFLVANKMDIEYMSDPNTMQEAKELAIETACQLIETSAKTGHNIAQLFEMTATLLYNELSDMVPSNDSLSDDEVARNTIHLDQYDPSMLNPERSSRCCSLNSVQET